MNLLLKPKRSLNLLWKLCSALTEATLGTTVARHVLWMIDKINLQEWTGRFQKLILWKFIIFLQASKIHYGSYNKSTRYFSFKFLIRNPPKKIGVQVETVILQKDSKRISLILILPCIDQDLHGIELQLVPVWRAKRIKI